MSPTLGLAAAVLRATARLLVFALSVTTLGPMLHGAHDAELAPVIIAHDHSLTHMQAADAAEVAGDHCVACHFVRSSRGPASWEVTGLIAFARQHGLVCRGNT